MKGKSGYSFSWFSCCGLTVECSFCHNTPTQIPFLGVGTHFRLGVNDSLSPLLLVWGNWNPVVSLNLSHIFIKVSIPWIPQSACHLFPAGTLIHMVIIIIKFAYLVGAKNFFTLMNKGNQIQFAFTWKKQYYTFSIILLDIVISPLWCEHIYL